MTTTVEPIKLADFIQRQRVTMKAERHHDNPNMPDRDIYMDHWRVVLRCAGRRMTTYFSMGLGLGGREPSAADVLDALASDAASYEDAATFEEWCREYGYDTDSRKAERTYRVIEKQADRLLVFLGSSAAYDTLLYHTERL